MIEASPLIAMLSIGLYILVKIGRKQRKKRLNRTYLINSVNEAVSSIAALCLGINLSYNWLTNENVNLLKVPDGQVLIIFYLLVIFIDNISKNK